MKRRFACLLPGLLVAACQVRVEPDPAPTPTARPATARPAATALPAATASPMVASATPSSTPASDLPAWLQALIDRHARAPVANPPVRIYRSSFRGQTVYYEKPGCCDQFTSLYAADGTVLCHPDGGMTGGGDGKCPDFYGQGEPKLELVWQDPRK